MKRFNIFLLMTVFIIFSPFFSQAIQTKGIKMVIKDKSGRKVGLYKGSHALIIGVSRYTAGWPNLESIPGEMDQIKTALMNQGFNVKEILNPTSDQLNNAFEDFIDRYGFDRDSRLIFFFSGHGYTRMKGKKGYIVPSDAPDPRLDEKGFLRKAIPMGQILTWSKEIEAKHALFVFDSCFSGTIFKTKGLPKHPPHISNVTSRPVRQFISAGSAGQEVPARSVFVPSFIRALRGEGDLDRDGYVTGTEMGMYLHRKVLSYETGQTPQYGKIKDPDLDEGDFVFQLGRPAGSATQSSSSVLEDERNRLAEERARIERERRELQQLKALQEEKERLEAERKKLEADRKRLNDGKQLAYIPKKRPVEPFRDWSGMKINYSNFLPSTHPQSETAKEWAKEVERRTDGKIKISYFPGGTLTRSTQVYDGVVQGISDLGTSVFAYSKNRFPVMGILDLPLGYPDGKLASLVAYEFLKSGGYRELQDVKVLYVHATGPSLLHTVRPIRTLEDMRGMKIKGTGNTAKLIKSLGGVPVMMPMVDVITALQKGVIDGLFCTAQYLKLFKLADIIKSTTLCYGVAPTTTFFVVMNHKRWEALPPGVKAILENINEEWVNIHGTAWETADRQGLAYSKSRGNTVISLSPQENARWQRAAQPVINNYVSNIQDGEEYVRKIRGLINRYSNNT